MNYKELLGIRKIRLNDRMFEIQALVDDCVIALATPEIEDVDEVLKDYVELWFQALKEKK